MHPFQTPEFSSAMKREWVQTTKFSFRSPDLLKKYHQMFNTITIPISSPESFFNDAITAARSANSREDLEKELGEIQERRRQEYVTQTEAIGHVWLPSKRGGLDDSICFAALNVGKTGSLEHLLQFINGILFGWDAVEQKDMEPDRPLKEVDEDELCETQYFPDAYLHVPGAHEDTGLHLDAQDWRFEEFSDHNTSPLLLSSGDGCGSSSLKAEREGREEKADEEQVMPSSTTPQNLLPTPGGRQSRPSSPPPITMDSSLDKKQPSSSPNSALKGESPSSSSATSPTSLAASKTTPHSLSETTEEVVAGNHSHFSPSINSPLTSKRRREEDDNNNASVGKKPRQ